MFFDFTLYLLVAAAGAFILAVWLTPLGSVVNAAFCDRCGICRHHHRATGAWTETVVMDTNTALGVLTDALKRCRREDMHLIEMRDFQHEALCASASFDKLCERIS